MNGLTSEPPGPRIGRMVSKVARRLIGFVLLSLTVGLTTCSALDAVKAPDATTTIERSLDGGAR